MTFRMTTIQMDTHQIEFLFQIKMVMNNDSFVIFVGKQCQESF